MSKRVLILFLSLTLIISMIPTSSYATYFSDMPNNWSTSALENAISNGLIQGDSSKIMAEGYLTRAQLATVINKAFRSVEESPLDKYIDMKSNEWFYNEMAKAVSMGIFNGYDSKLFPDKHITREEAFVVISRALRMISGDIRVLDNFLDKDIISDWAINEVTSLVSAGYIIGSDSNLNPKKIITKAEFAKIMDNIIKNYISEPSIITSLDAGNTMINSPNVTLRNLTVSGDLIIGDGVGDGYVILDNIIVEGRTLIRGGNDSIKIVNNSELKIVLVSKMSGPVKLFVEDGVKIEKIIIDGNIDVKIEGYVDEVVILSSNILVGIMGNIVEMLISETANNIGVNILGGANVKKILVEGKDVEIYGEGKLREVEANSTNISVTTTDTLVKAALDSAGVLAGGEIVKAGSTLNTTVDRRKDGRDQTKDQDEEGKLGGVADIDCGYFTFNPTNGTITGYSRSGPKDVIIPPEINGIPVTTIGYRAFANLDLLSVKLPDSVVAIGFSAFGYNKLTNLIIPASVEIIDSWAFYMNDISNLVIGNNVKRIGDSAFEFSDLATIMIPDSVTYLGNNAFRENKLTKIVIGSGAFIGDLLLTGTLSAPNNNFRDAYYPEKKAGTYIGTREGIWTRLTEEQYFTFDEATKTITSYDERGGLSVGIPPTIRGVSVENIGKEAFANKNLYKVIMQNTIKVIGDNAFINNSLENITIPSGVTDIGNGSFAYNSLKTVSIPSSVFSIGNSAFLNNSIGSISVPNNVTTIGDSAFQNNNIDSVSIGSRVASIGSSAFANNNLTTLNLPGSLRKIGRLSFIENEINEIRINSSVEIDDNILNSSNNNFRDAYTVRGSGKYVGTQEGEWIRLTDERYFTFDSSTQTITGYDIAGGVDVVIPTFINGVPVLKIGDRAFVSKGITSVVLPETVTSIDYMSFGDNSISNVEFPDSLIKIAGRAFYMNLLTEIELSKNITHIGEWAFSENQLSAVTLNDKLQEIGEWAFWMNAIEKIAIPDSVTTLGLGAFAVNALTEVDIGDGITTIGIIAFSSNEISEIVFGKNVTTIGESAFKDNKLTYLRIPSSVTSIDNYSFMNNRLIEILIPDNINLKYSSLVNNNLKSITIGSGVTIWDKLLNYDGNNFRDAYTTSGAGTYVGSQSGPWVKYIREAPKASFTYDPATGIAPLSVTFINTSTGEIDSCSWDLNGDGIIDSTSDGIVNYTYESPGTYIAVLTATNSGGSNSKSIEITVEATVPEAPKASFTYNPATGSAPLSVTFINTTIGEIDSCSWDLNGDGTIDSTSISSVDFIYDIPGSYYAMLTVTNSTGSSNMKMMITVDNE